MYEVELRVAMEAVERACRLCRTVRAALVDDETIAKRDKSPVTVADFGSQAVVADALARAFPDDPLVAEEDAAALREPDGQALLDRVVGYVRDVAAGLDRHAVCAAIDRGAAPGGAGGRCWVLDPIDGTKGFLRGGQYAVALALIEDGRPVLGVLGCPNLSATAVDAPAEGGVLLMGVRGHGARQMRLATGDTVVVHCSSRARATEAVLCESVESGHTAHGASADIAACLGVQATPVRLDSQCKYAVVARGEADVYLRLPTSTDYEEKVWDHAAGWLIVTEAGGTVIDVDGKPLDFSMGRTLCRNRGVVATNGPLSEVVRAAVRSSRV